MADIDAYEIHDSYRRQVDAYGNYMRTRVFSVPYASRLTLAEDVALGTYDPNDDQTGTGTAVAGTFTADDPSFIASHVGSTLTANGTDYTITAVNSAVEVTLSIADSFSDKSFTVSGPGLISRRVVHREVRADRPGEPGRSTILALYRRPIYRWPDESDSGQQVRGRLVTSQFGQKVEMKRDLDDKVITGLQESDVDATQKEMQRKGCTWEVTQGDPYQLKVYPTHTLQCLASEDWDSSTVASLVGDVNDDSALGVAAGKLMFFGSREVTTWFESQNTVREVELQFVENPDGWNSSVKSRIFRKVPVDVERIEEDGTATGEYATVMRKVALDKDDNVTTEQTRRIATASDFSVFGNMISI